ncbi:MAG: carbamoyltransferase HypF, partial [Calditrichaeota bacterium]
MTKTLRKRIVINGIVQGVGFRPHVYRLARQHHLSGFVRNGGEGVTIEVQGAVHDVAAFTEKLRAEPPPLSVVESIVEEQRPVGQSDGFHIINTDRSGQAHTFISPDVAVCDACLSELFDPDNRRYRYPFINCTNCGPRYTIVRHIPYDRPYTSMQNFELCPRCRAEYDNPADRRFHAQPNACPECGPHVWLCDAGGQRMETDDAIRACANLLSRGAVLAVRGLGGFHLVVDATDDRAVAKLRRRKKRPGKPFALMAPDTATVERYAFLSEEERRLLESPVRPIVLLRKKETDGLADNVAPGNKYLGFMLPYTPLHHLLLRDHGGVLVMTSANLSDEPIVTGNEEALERLAGIADYFLLHNREIVQRCDDSIAWVEAGQTRLGRRSRGYVPAPLNLGSASSPEMLAVGGMLKSTIALSRGGQVFLSQHIGDLDNERAYAFFKDSIEHLQRILQIEPSYVVCDKHPEYLSSKWARAQPLPCIEVQHHHAHMAAVMAEHGLNDNVLALILDGTGYGDDGTIWGGEVLAGNRRTYERRAWLRPIPLPGGETAIHEPWRIAAALVDGALGSLTSVKEMPFWKERKERDAENLRVMIRRGINTPLSSGCGRLFDGVSALLGLCSHIDYEAEAAIRLEMISDPTVTEGWGVEARPETYDGALDWAPMVRCLLQGIQQSRPTEELAARFHFSLAEMWTRVLCRTRDELGLNTVV